MDLYSVLQKATNTYEKHSMLEHVTSMLEHAASMLENFFVS